MDHGFGGRAKNQSRDSGDDLQEALETLMVYFPYNATLGCLVIFLNSLILYFYHKQYRKFVPCMYLLLALFDWLMIIFMITSYCLVFKIEGESSDHILKHKWVIIGFKFGEKWSLRMSIFINALLSVARTLKTVRPFSEIKMSKALLSVLVYGSFWIVLISLDVFSLTKDLSHISKKYLSDRRRFKRFIVEDRVGSETVYLVVSESESPILYLFFFTYLISYVLPVLVCLVSATVMIFYLRKEPPSQQSAVTQRHVSVTVLFITIAFVLSFGVPSLYDLASKVSREVSGKYGPVSIGDERHVLVSTVPLINTLCNPVILIWRSGELRGRLRKVFRTSRWFVKKNDIELQPELNAGESLRS